MFHEESKIGIWIKHFFAGRGRILIVGLKQPHWEGIFFAKTWKAVEKQYLRPKELEGIKIRIKILK